MKNYSIDFEKYRKSGKFTLSSGVESPYYYDMKEMVGDPKNLWKIIKEIAWEIELTKRLKIDVIIGVATGGIAVAVGLSLYTKIPFAILRKEKNPHGMEKRIEGWQGKGNVLLVDDVKTSGITLNNSKTYLESLGYSVKAIKVIYDRSKK